MDFWDRQYRLSAGAAGGTGFEIGEGSPMPLHISFSLEKADVQSPNTAKISLWNLSPTHLATLNRKDCVVTLKAGYGSSMPLIFTGTVTNVETEADGADTRTDLEVLDGRKELRDTYVTLSYLSTINSKKVIESVAGEMGLPVVFSEQAQFIDLPDYSFVGPGKDTLDRICNTNKLVWSIQNGILQVRGPNEPINMRAFLLSPKTGLVDVPKKLTKGEKNSGNATANSQENKNQTGWEITYLLNAAIGVNDYVKLESKKASGVFRVSKIKIEGDNFGERWICTAEILEVG